MSHFKTATLFLFSFFLSLPLFAAQITNIKDNRVLVTFEGEAAEPGTQFFILNQEGKKIGLVEIKKVKGEKAIAEILKGRAEIGGELIPRSAAAPKKQAKNEDEEETAKEDEEEKPVEKTRPKKTRHNMGAMFGYGMNTMSLTIQSATNSALKTDANLKGTSFSIKGFYDYEWTKDFTIRAEAGLEPYAVGGTGATSTGTALCSDGTSTNCQINLNYLALDGIAQYNLSKGATTRIWLGLGYSFLITMSKTINVPNFSQTGGTNQMILFAGGLDYSISKTSYIPVSFEYGYIPGDNVKASSMYLRAGYGMRF